MNLQHERIAALCESLTWHWDTFQRVVQSVPNCAGPG